MKHPLLLKSLHLLAGFAILWAFFFAGQQLKQWLHLILTDPKAIGLALGCGSHGVGTARALELGRVHGAFASLGMSCSAMLASVVGPLVLRYLIL